MDKSKQVILFLIPSLIWGSTWFVIKFQLGVVHPVLSVAYRSGIAGVLLLLGCLLFRQNLKYNLKQHLFIALQGLCLYSVNYWMVYIAENYLTSGLIAVMFSLIMFMNIALNSIILKAPLRKEALVGGILGITGTFFVFKQELMQMSTTENYAFAVIICLGSMTLASFGNIISARNQKNKLPVLQTNAFGMTYGALILVVISLFLRIELTFDPSGSYVLSLIYLAIFGSIVAFSSYLSLLGKIGPDRAAYTILLIPIIAMVISTIFEDYQWRQSAILGILLVVTGNLLIINKKWVNRLKFKSV
ncbi:MAG: EamA family transporter [Bacteroidetes bacterium]|nr:EamA family transporter [Bacteroidota bacterium]